MPTHGSRFANFLIAKKNFNQASLFILYVMVCLKIYIFFLSFSGHYPVYYLPPVPEQNLPPAHHTDNLLAGIARATHQDEDGDTYVDILKKNGLG